MPSGWASFLNNKCHETGHPRATPSPSILLNKAEILSITSFKYFQPCVQTSSNFNRYKRLELTQRAKWADPRCQCLLGQISSQLGCTEEGKQRLNQGFCHLTWLLCSVCCSSEKKSKTVATREALFSKASHSLSKYGARLDEPGVFNAGGNAAELLKS